MAATNVDIATHARELGLTWRADQLQFNELWNSQEGDTTEPTEGELRELRELGYVSDDDDERSEDGD